MTTFGKAALELADGIENVPVPKALRKINSSGTVRVWWIPILTRGKLHIAELPDKFSGETEEGAALMVSKVRAALNIRFQGRGYCA